MIEDDPDVRNLVSIVLRQSGFETVPASNGEEGIAAVREHQPVLTTLDVSMPGMGGMAAAALIREFSDTYLIMITAQDDEIDVISGLDAGADDYLSKPFRPRELRSRVADIQARPVPQDPAASDPAEAEPREPREPRESRRGGSPDVPVRTASTEQIEFGGLHLDVPAREVLVDGVRVHLTEPEAVLLHTLMSTGRRVRSTADLASTLRGGPVRSGYTVTEEDKSEVGRQIAALRRALDGDDPERWIQSVSGVGYRMSG